MLIVKDLSASYPGGHRVLSGVSFMLERGERVALIGANGAGKSTLLRAIMGLLPITAGEIEVDGITLSKRTASEVRKRVGIVFQNPDDQLFMASVRDDVAFGPRNMGLSDEEVDCRVDSALERLGAIRLKERISDRLSVGEKRVVGVASILSMSPGTILLDEPSSSLDPRSRRTLIEMLGSLPQAILVATHDLDMAKRLCPRTIVLRQGTLCAEGATDEIISDEGALEQYGL
ncbi:MAG: energy-coupling factor ABC transporter ATP-binding protein [Synergistaceae bacterium]|nr:energy-coupling factor ABC transporter ATP-binding protein [Synergistaceae bacterium]